MEDQKTSSPEQVEQQILQQGQEHERPYGLKYKQISFFGRLMPWYASPKVQLAMVSMVCFMTVGMFNSISGMGGGGKIDATTADEMNIALYSTFAAGGIFGGSAVNRLGIRITLTIGATGYCLYVVALLLSVHTDKTRGFNIFAGLYLGICAALLWTAEGTVILSYPAEGAKGRYFAWFWSTFNLGGMIGSLIPLAGNIEVQTNSTVTDSTYIAFIILMASGVLIAFFNPTWKTEWLGLWDTLIHEPFVVLLFPLFTASNWFITYQFNGINNAYFSTRTKALNSVFYWFAQILGALLFGHLLDWEHYGRRTRARLLLVVIFSFTMVMWGGGYAFARLYTREDTVSSTFVPSDWTTSGYGPRLVLYTLYGFYDASLQASVYWYVGALSNNSRRLANYFGFFKGLQSAGAAVAWGLDSRKLSFMAQFAITWALLAGSIVIAAPVILVKIKDHVDVADDIKFSDETLEYVIGFKERQDCE